MQILQLYYKKIIKILLIKGLREKNIDKNIKKIGKSRRYKVCMLFPILIV